VTGFTGIASPDNLLEPCLEACIEIRPIITGSQHQRAFLPLVPRFNRDSQLSQDLQTCGVRRVNLVLLPSVRRTPPSVPQALHVFELVFRRQSRSAFSESKVYGLIPGNFFSRSTCPMKNLQHRLSYSREVRLISIGASLCTGGLENEPVTVTDVHIIRPRALKIRYRSRRCDDRSPFSAVDGQKDFQLHIHRR
jgi:hypothetical protein